ncbi:ATP-binding protein [uncultured Piscinibacter sp.]|uniref:ATP-binding protein n=1 Tax=uncultured Piscinibacter sp. TaxID=1131835 RepID=UPI002610CD83|nr:ATP-binding protein [uncultured Piscinibacter sp.]
MDQFVPVRGTMDEALALFRAAHRWPPVVGTMDRGLAGDGASAGVRRRSLVGPMGPALVGAIGRWCQVLGDEAELNAQVRYRLELCAAGLTTNLLKYGGEACEGSRVHVQVVLDAHRLSLTLVDRCAPFDPLAAPPRTPAQRVEDMPVGGQGLHLLAASRTNATTSTVTAATG